MSFFAYPGKASDLVPEGCEVHVLADGRRRRRRRARAPGRRRRRAADAVPRCRPRAGPTARPATSPPRPSPTALGALLPEGAIVSDEGNTPGLFVAGRHRRLPAATTGCRLTGGAIGHGLPVGDRRRRGLPATARCVNLAGRRQRAVHAPGAVDAGPRGPRRHHGHPQQPLLRHPQHGAEPGRRRRPGPKALGDARPHRARTSTSSRWPRAWASPPTRADRRRGAHRRSSERALAEPGPHLIDAMLPPTL